MSRTLKLRRMRLVKRSREKMEIDPSSKQKLSETYV